MRVAETTRTEVMLPEQTQLLTLTEEVANAEAETNEEQQDARGYLGARGQLSGALQVK